MVANKYSELGKALSVNKEVYTDIKQIADDIKNILWASLSNDTDAKAMFYAVGGCKALEEFCKRVQSLLRTNSVE